MEYILRKGGENSRTNKGQLDTGIAKMRDDLSVLSNLNYSPPNRSRSVTEDRGEKVWTVIPILISSGDITAHGHGSAFYRIRVRRVRQNLI